MTADPSGPATAATVPSPLDYDADLRIPSYAFPEDAAIALASVARYGEWLARPPFSPAQFDDVRRDEAAAIIAASLGRGAGWLAPDEVERLLSCYGLPVLEQRVAATPEEAAREAAALGEQVALKGMVPGLLHKTEAGAVRLKLKPQEVRAAAQEMAERLSSSGSLPTGYLVQRMAPAGLEMIVGVVHDRQVGPIVACGAGGVLVELLQDDAVRLTPLSKPDAEEMLRELKTFPLLTGYRGRPSYDVPALAEAILRVGAMVEDLPEIAELDLNPILVHARGVAVMDAHVKVTSAAPSPPLGALPLANLLVEQEPG
jgi:acyl-CoA synthetase (NDP forming)